MGPEYIAIIVAATTAAATGGGWISAKILNRFHERIRKTETRLSSLETEVRKMPLDYVLKVDFLREIQQMHEHFKDINTKLDRMIDRLIR
jgi:microcompartment protein CcmL/EutN